MGWEGGHGGSDEGDEALCNCRLQADKAVDGRCGSIPALCQRVETP